MNVKNYLNWKNVIAGIFAVLILSSSILLTSAFVYKKNAVSGAVVSAAFKNANALNTDKFKVYGLVCGDTFCVTSIQNALYKIKGVVSARIYMENQEAIVNFMEIFPREYLYMQ